jgi:hypothetical protein
MDLASDPARAGKIGPLLYSAFNESSTGIFGHTTMPEDILPLDVERGSLEHRMFITLTVSIDYMRDAEVLWAASRRAFEDKDTRYLFYPQEVALVDPARVARDLQRSGVALRPNQDGHIWRTVALTLLEKWQGDPLNLVKAAAHDARGVLRMVRSELGFPFLRGPKISSLWVRMLRDNVGLQLSRMDQVPIPMDIHIGRATLSTGVLRGRFRGTLDQIRPYVEEVWAKGLEGSRFIPLDIDEPLWHLSRYGCSKRSPDGCPVTEQCPVQVFCARGMVRVSTEALEVNT